MNGLSKHVTEVERELLKLLPQGATAPGHEQHQTCIALAQKLFRQRCRQQDGQMPAMGGSGVMVWLADAAICIAPYSGQSMGSEYHVPLPAPALAELRRYETQPA
jgi:hypothetical protein